MFGEFGGYVSIMLSNNDHRDGSSDYFLRKAAEIRSLRFPAVCRIALDR